MLLCPHNPDKALDAMNSALRIHDSLMLSHLANKRAAILAYRNY
jgi:hypothetical protein